MAGIGRFGAYIKHGASFESLASDDDVLTIGLNRAVVLLAQPAAERGRGPLLLREGSEAVAAVTEWLLSQPGVHQVRAHTLTDNMPSRRVLEKAGFQYLGLDEGEALYQRP